MSCMSGGHVHEEICLVALGHIVPPDHARTSPICQRRPVLYPPQALSARVETAIFYTIQLNTRRTT